MGPEPSHPTECQRTALSTSASASPSSSARAAAAVRASTRQDHQHLAPSGASHLRARRATHRAAIQHEPIATPRPVASASRPTMHGGVRRLDARARDAMARHDRPGGQSVREWRRRQRIWNGHGESAAGGSAMRFAESTKTTDGTKAASAESVHIRKRHDDYQVAGHAEAGRRAVELHDTGSGDPGKDVCVESRTIIDVHHLHEFEFPQVCRCDQRRVEGERSFVVQIR